MISKLSFITKNFCHLKRKVTSSINQNLDRQLELLSKCDKIFTDKVSGKYTNREGF